MKNTIVKPLVLCVLLVLFCSAALSLEDPLAGITIMDGWMTGMVTAHFDIGQETESYQALKVDCPEPPAAYPAKILTVAEGYVSKKQMRQALKAAGQSTEGKFQNSRGFAAYTGDWNAEASADISKEEAAAQATQIGLKYFEALGVKVDPVPYSVSRPYDYDAYMARQTAWFEHAYSDVSTFVDNARANWKRTSKYHPKQSEYTRVSYYILLDGMRLDRTPSYPAGYKDEPDAWKGFGVSADVIVSDSGILVEASCSLLEIKKRRPLEGDPVYDAFIPRFHALAMGRRYIDAESWQEALTGALMDSSRVGSLGSNSEDAPYMNKSLTNPIIAYGSKTVITEIYPILHTISRSEWAPFWQIETKREFSDGWRK